MNEQLIEHIPAVYKFALRLSRGHTHRAEDILQETMLRALKHYAQIDENSRIKSWLFAIAANVAKDRAKRSSSRRETLSDTLEETYQYEENASEKLESAELWSQAMEQLDKLPDKQRSVLYLHTCEQLSLAQIADVLGITKSAAKANLSLARARLATKLGLTKELRHRP